MKWYLKCLSQYADFQGRARRKEYWMFVLINSVISLIFSIFILLPNSSYLRLVLLFTYLVYSLLVIIPGLAVCVRRLHDIGKSGWNYLLVLIPLVGPILLLIWFCMPGEVSFNEWGENPKYYFDSDDESDVEAEKGKTGIIQIYDFDLFAQRLEDQGFPISGKKKDSLNVNYRGTKLTVYKTKAAYKVTPKISWLFLLILAIVVGVIFVGEKTGRLDLFSEFGVPITLVVAIIYSFFLFFIIGGIYNLTKRKNVQQFCEEMTE